MNFKLYPFTAILGHDELKLALILNVIDPKIGGLLIFGDRGTGKSTIVRSLRDLLPDISVIKKDDFNLDPMEYPEKIDFGIEQIKIPLVDLPLGSTEDRICGSINIKKTIEGENCIFERGLLAKANRGILYVDEINLLDDYLVDILLDTIASGWNIVEREGISIKHPAQFILIGSGNPEEAELRPQLLDRFGMYIKIETLKNITLRTQIIQNRLFFDKDPYSMYDKYKKKQINLQKKILFAQQLLSKVEISYNFITKISIICNILNLDGIRGDIVCVRAAKALAAFQGRTHVLVSDIKKILVFCLIHRIKQDLKRNTDFNLEKIKIEKIFNEIFFNYLELNSVGIEPTLES